MKVGVSSNKPKTVAVLGIARGGTSLVAGLLRELGIFMGDQIHPTKHEWAFFDDVENTNELQDKIEFYNQRHDIWGFKKPSFSFDFFRYQNIFRCLHLIIVFRSSYNVLLSEFNRNGVKPEFVINDIAVTTQKLAEIINASVVPCLLLGYEETIMHPEKTIKDIESFLHITSNPSNNFRAHEFIKTLKYGSISSEIMDNATKSRIVIDERYEALDINIYLHRNRIEYIKSSIAAITQDTTAAMNIAVSKSGSPVHEKKSYSPVSSREENLNQMMQDKERGIPDKKQELASLVAEVEGLMKLYCQSLELRQRIQIELDSYQI